MGLLLLGLTGRGHFLIRGPFVAGLLRTIGGTHDGEVGRRCPPRPQYNAQRSAPLKPHTSLSLPVHKCPNNCLKENLESSGGFRNNSFPLRPSVSVWFSPSPCATPPLLPSTKPQTPGDWQDPGSTPLGNCCFSGCPCPESQPCVTRQMCPLYNLFPSTCVTLGRSWGSSVPAHSHCPSHTGPPAEGRARLGGHLG